MNWNERLREIREEMKWMSAECLKADEYECSHAATGICIMIADMQNKLSDHGLEDADWNRPAHPTAAEPYEPPAGMCPSPISGKTTVEECRAAGQCGCSAKPQTPAPAAARDDSVIQK